MCTTFGDGKVRGLSAGIICFQYPRNATASFTLPAFNLGAAYFSQRSWAKFRHFSTCCARPLVLQRKTFWTHHNLSDHRHTVLSLRCGGFRAPFPAGTAPPTSFTGVSKRKSNLQILAEICVHLVNEEAFLAVAEDGDTSWRRPGGPGALRGGFRRRYASFK